MIDREKVFEVIELEREYQDMLWGPMQEGGKHNVTEFLVYIEDYVAEAKHLMSRYASPASDEKALHIVRKVAALAVACMEQNGNPRRDFEDLSKRVILP